ncbi:MAG: class I SAM-dependent methyltransferase [Cytophagaceae bacterium]|nr:class I SAM-dependent methyltransferase [Cytophagaceae bacterium]
MIDSLLSAEARAFLHRHASDDPTRLLLQANRYPHLPVRELVHQLAARQRMAAKLPIWTANAEVVFPSSLSLEQSSSEQTARYKAGLVSGGTLADLTGGLGVDAWAFAQRMERVFYVEQNADLAQLAAHNLPALGLTNVAVFNQDALDFLQNSTQLQVERGKAEVDWIYLDPARRDATQSKVFRLEDCEPNVLTIKDLLLKTSRNVLLKAAPMLDLDLAFRQLEHAEKVVVLAVDGEVKELLFVLTRQAVIEPDIVAVNLLKNGLEQTFAFRRSEEAAAEVVFSPPQHYLYEPHAALLKAGAFRLLSARFGIAKLHANSHLYTAETLHRDFPGRIFEVKAVCKPDKNTLRNHLDDTRANLTVRNFPASVAELRKRLALKEGGDAYVFATTDPAGRHILVVTGKDDGQTATVERNVGPETLA